MITMMLVQCLVPLVSILCSCLMGVQRCLPSLDIIVTRTVAGNALPDDRLWPMRLPGRMGLPEFWMLFVRLTVWPSTILPEPTPDRAFDLARNIMSGNRLLRLLVTILLVVWMTSLVMLVGSLFNLLPVRVVVPPSMFSVCITVWF